MPGTLVKDTLEPVLYSDTAITAAVTSTGVAVNKPGDVRVVLTTGTVTGTNPTFDVEVQGSNSSTFASGVVSYGRFNQLVAADASSTFYLQARVYKTYMRVVTVIGGTSTPTFNTVAVKVRAREYLRTPTDSA